MSVRIYTGAAATKLDTGTLTIGGTIEVGDIFKVTLGNSSVQISATTTVVATTATELLAALQDEDNVPAPFNTITWASGGAGVITWEGPDDGRPVGGFITATTTESDGGAADTQTFVKAAVVVGTGPKDLNNPDNWSGSTLPVDNDEVHLGLSDVCPQYNLEELDDVELDFLYVHSTDEDEQVIGLDPYNEEDGFYEYMPTHLKMETVALRYGIGNGRFVPRMFFNQIGNVGTDFRFFKTNDRDNEDNAPVHLVSGIADSGISECRGHVDIGTLPNVTSAFGTIVANPNGRIRVGPGGTGSAVTLLAEGGTIDYHCPSVGSVPTTMTAREGGVINYQGAGSGGGNTTTTVTVFPNSTLNHWRTGHTITTLVLMGSLNCAGGPTGAKTVTSLEAFAGASINDPEKLLTVTNWDLNGCGIEDLALLNIGKNIRISRGTPA